MKKSLNTLLAAIILVQAVPVSAGLKNIDIALAYRIFNPIGCSWYNTDDIAKTEQALEKAKNNYQKTADLCLPAMAMDAFSQNLPKYYQHLSNAESSRRDAQTAYDTAYNDAELKPNAWAYRLAAGSISVAVLGGIAFLANKLIAKLKKNDEQVATPSVSDAKTANI